MTSQSLDRNSLVIPSLPYKTLPEALLAAPKDKPFLTMWRSDDDVQSASFGEFTRLALTQAAYLQQEGLRAGDTVILIMPQGIPLMAAFVGAMYLGAIPTILAYPNFKVEPAKYRLGLTGVSANLKARLVVLDDKFPDELLGHVAVGESTKLVRYGKDPFPKPVAPPEILEPEQVAFIQHSAGTTGLQKGVALSHAAVLRHLRRLAPALMLRPDDRIYSWLPLYHDMGLIACFMLPMVCHLPVVMQSPTDWVLQPATMLQIISEYRCTLSWMPNFTFQFLARRVRPEDRPAYDLSCVRALINCSEPVRASSLDEFLNVFSACGLRAEALQSSYAMAETVFAVTQSPMDGQNGSVRLWIDSETFRREHTAAPVRSTNPRAVCYMSSGRCLPDTRIRVVSETGEDLSAGGVGEILIQSDSLLSGYYNRPDVTAKALRDGWYWSGDLGFVLDGEVFVVGRKKDLIIVAGENIYPQDVEEIVSSHPAIHDGRVVAFGLYNPDLGTEEIVIVAELVKEEDLANSLAIEQELRNAVVGELGVSSRLIYLKPPKWVVKSTAGKPARSTTREKLLSEHPELRFHSPEEKGLNE
jgi:fatty-acyl-CoA synthase